MSPLEVISDAWAQGGLAMPPLFGIAVLLGWALGERAWCLRRGTRAPVEALWNNPRTSFGGLLTSAGQALVALPAALRREEHIEVALTPWRAELGRGRTMIRALVVAAPLLGLLGTVTGMIETFDAMAEMALFRQSGGVAGGVAQALLSTQVGLCVAIPGLLVGRLLDRVAANREDELDRLGLFALGLPLEGEAFARSTAASAGRAEGGRS